MRGVRIVERDDNKGCKTTLQLTTPLEESAPEAGTEVRHLTLVVCQAQCHPHQVVLERHSDAVDMNAVFKHFLSNVFLPAGYPHSVSPGRNFPLFPVWSSQ